jgi:hypothetical protein
MIGDTIFEVLTVLKNVIIFEYVDKYIVVVSSILNDIFDVMFIFEFIVIFEVVLIFDVVVIKSEVTISIFEVIVIFDVVVIFEVIIIFEVIVVFEVINVFEYVSIFEVTNIFCGPTPTAIRDIKFGLLLSLITDDHELPLLLLFNKYCKVVAILPE